MPDDGPLESAVPPATARILAFGAIVLAGICGGLIGWKFTALDPAAMARLAEQMLAHMAEQTRQIDARDQQIAQQAQALKFKDARIERITFELARLKARKGASIKDGVQAMMPIATGSR